MKDKKEREWACALCQAHIVHFDPIQTIVRSFKCKGSNEMVPEPGNKRV